MKRMTENPISYYTVTPDDLKNITSQGEGMFSYTPSPEFVEVLHDFKAVLRIDWTKVNETIWHKIGATFSVLYPINKVSLGDGEVGYAYSAGSTGTKQVNPMFFDMQGQYFINWNLN